jgi:UDP-glucuronate decarboxylase
VHAEDAVLGLARVLVLGRPGEAYNIGSMDHVTSEELARRIAAAAPFEVTVELAAPRAPPDHMVLSIAKAGEQVGYAPARRLDEHLPPAVHLELGRRS